MKMFARFFIPIVLTVLLISALQAQVLVVSKSQDSDSEESSTETLYIDKDRLCMETQSADNHTATVYRPGPLMLIMDMEKGTYMEMNKEDFAQMKAMARQTNQQMEEYQKQAAPQMEEAQKMLEEQKKKMTPEQQKLMEKYMPKAVTDAPGSAEPEKTIYKKVSSGVKVGKWVCDKYEGYDGDEKVEEVWSADLKTLGVTPEDVKVFEEFAKLFEEFSKGKNEAAFRIGSKEFEAKQGYPGVAVKTVTFYDGEVESTREVVQVERKSGFDDALFQPRPGLKKTDNYMKQMQQQKMQKDY